MDHKALRCKTEKFLKARLCPLGIAFSNPAYCTIDRLDYRESGNLYTVDYETSLAPGNPTKVSLGPEGYFPQLIFYRWIVEQELGQEVTAAMICTPLADRAHKYVKVNTASLEAQREVIRQGEKFEKEGQKARETGLFHGCQRPYCKTRRKAWAKYEAMIRSFRLK